MAVALEKVPVLRVQKAFYLAASHRQIKKITSLRPRRLCGENPFWTKVKGAYEFALRKE